MNVRTRARFRMGVVGIAVLTASVMAGGSIGTTASAAPVSSAPAAAVSTVLPAAGSTAPVTTALVAGAKSFVCGQVRYGTGAHSWGGGQLCATFDGVNWNWRAAVADTAHDGFCTEGTRNVSGTFMSLRPAVRMCYDPGWKTLMVNDRIVAAMRVYKVGTGSYFCVPRPRNFNPGDCP